MYYWLQGSNKTGTFYFLVFIFVFHSNKQFYCSCNCIVIKRSAYKLKRSVNYIKGCGMGPWLVLVSPCFRENVVATCKIGFFFV